MKTIYIFSSVVLTCLLGAAQCAMAKDLYDVNVINETLDVCVEACDGPLPVSPPKVVAVGFSRANYGAEINGIGGMNALCQQSFGSQARMCTTIEAAETPNLARITEGKVGYVDPRTATTQIICDSPSEDCKGYYTDRAGFVRQTGLFADPVDALVRLIPNCRRWTSTSGTDGGAFVSSGMLAATIGCNAGRQVLCCAPTH